MINHKVQVGVLGGARGNTMIQELLQHPDAELVAVCDKYEPLLDKVKEEAQKVGLNVALYTDFDEFLKHPGMDAVVLANYATEHATFAIKCLNAGKHVMSEVLPSETISQAIELIETVEKTKLVYTYAENYCYMDVTFEMWRRYQNGDIGEVQYAECDYIHDCSSVWQDITYGEKNHWRNHLCPTFQCSHSLGPIIASTGLRPIKVVGFENPPIPEFYNLGHVGGHASGIEMVTLENGAIVKSIHGPLKREPAHTRYKIYGSKGYLGTAEDEKISFYCEDDDTLCKGKSEVYKPEKFLDTDLANSSNLQTHGGSDFYPTHCFIEKILGKEAGKWCIDVYQAVDMGICGILAMRSILNGNKSIEIPDLRKPENRDKYRNDKACTNPAVAGDQVIPCSSYGEHVVSDEVYNKMRDKWLNKQE